MSAVAEGRLLRRLIQAGARAEGDAFREVAAEVIQQERSKRHHLLANDLERILYGEQSAQHGNLHPRPDVPKDAERGLPLLQFTLPRLSLRDLVLSEESRAPLAEVILEQERRDVLASYGLRSASRLLFFGPPGCGKTTGAEVLATELGVQLATVRLDAVVSSYLGETAANLRKVFDFVEHERLVVLFDEFDSVGKKREDPGDHGELKRVVNAFLQLVDAYRGPSVLIAATNHERLLDRALWRRFDEVVRFDKPTSEQIRLLLELKTRAIPSELQLSDSTLMNRFIGMSHADIERVIVRAIKNMVLTGREVLSMDLVIESLRREDQRRLALEVEN